MAKIADIAPISSTPLPKVSIIVPACNEEETIGPALESLCTLDYPALEIIVVNDRSTDNTARVILSVKERFPFLQLIEISSLPDGWLGKSFALQTGADHAQGEYLLFTDADVHMEKTTLLRAMNHLLNNNLDHLSLIFHNRSPGGLLNTVLMDIGAGLLLLFKPWKAKTPGSKSFMGVGAFNLVRASAYRKISGHDSFSMHPIDDIMLGKILKEKHFRQECLLGHGFVELEWYSSTKDLINGTMKNTFALYNYNLFQLIAGVLAVFTVSIFPVWALRFTSGPTKFIFFILVCSRLCSFAFGLSWLGLPVRYAPWSLISPYINCFIAIKSAWMTLLNNGINWRGTHYPLGLLKKEKPLL